MQLRSAKGAGGIGQSVSNFLRATKHGLLGVLAISAKEGGVTWSWLPWLDLVARTWQMLSFVTNASLGLPWPASVTPIDVGGSFTNMRAYTKLFPSQTFAAVSYYLAVAWVATLCALLAWGVFHFTRESVPFVWPLRLLKQMANLSVGPLNIPLLQLLLAPLACQEGSACDSAFGATKGAVGAVLAVALTCLMLLFSAAFYDSNSLSRSPEASAHGRVNVIMLMVKLSATVVGGGVITNTSVAFVTSALAVCGVAWLGAYLYFLPYYRHVMNAANAGCALIFLWALACLVLNNSYPGTDAALTLWIGAPATFLAGAYICTGRAGAIAARPAAQLASVYEVELQNRYLLHQALYGHPFYKIHDHNSSVANSNATLAALLVQDTAGTGDEQGRAATLREAVPRELLTRVLATYRSAAARFPDSAMIHIFIARFYNEWMGNRHMMCVLMGGIFLPVSALLCSTRASLLPSHPTAPPLPTHPRACHAG